MKRTLALVTATVTLLALASCGLDKRGDVVLVGAGPSGERDETNSRSTEPAGWNRRISGPEDLVTQWLKAAAGDYGVANARQVAISRARNFLDPTTQAAWKPKETELKVVRVLGTPKYDPTKRRVTIDVQHLGVLTFDGKLDPPAAGSPTEYSFGVNQPSENMYYLQVDPAQDLLLSDTALLEFYAQTTLYYMTNDNRPVPDIRYLSLAISKEQHRTRQVEWLLGEPSGWLKPLVESLPRDVKLNGSVTTEGSSVTIDLSQQATPHLERLKRQFVKSLDAQTIKVKIVGLEKATAERPAPERRPNPAKYAVQNGNVVPLNGGQVTVKTKNVEAVAFSRGSLSAALVVRDGDGLDLLIGDPAAPIRVSGLQNRREISQPIWLDHEQVGVLALVDQELWWVKRTGAAKKVELPGKVKASSISVGPDGSRIAYVVNGRLLVARLVRQADDVAVSDITRQVPLTLTNLQSVAFATESHLIVAGTRGTEVQLADITIDGTVIAETKRKNYTASTKITHLVAYPVDESDRWFRDADMVMFVIDGKAYDGVFTSGNLPIDIAPSATVSPKPTAPPKSQTVTAPSFEG